MPSSPDTRWTKALTEHDEVLGHYLRTAREFDDDRWQRAPAAGRWSAAALTLHVADSYRFGRDAASGGPGMRMLAPRPVAFVSRHLVLPIMLALRRFPREAPAPAEVRPDATGALALPRDVLLARLERDATDALQALQQPHATRVTHAYFGSLSPHQALRLLTAHTRHHTIGLRDRLAAGGVALT